MQTNENQANNTVGLIWATLSTDGAAELTYETEVKTEEVLLSFSQTRADSSCFSRLIVFYDRCCVSVSVKISLA